MSANAQAAYLPHPDILFTELSESEAVLLSLPAACYFMLNETGSHIWRSLANGATPVSVAGALQERYEVEPHEALRYAEVFLAELLREGLVREAAAGE